MFGFCSNPVASWRLNIKKELNREGGKIIYMMQDAKLLGRNGGWGGGGGGHIGLEDVSIPI